MSTASQVTGAILAGGKSSRMGTDKALLELDGAPMIARIAGVMSPLFTELVILANHPGRYAFLTLPVWNDIVPGCGPLSGIHSALTRSTNDAVFIVACDLPYITSTSILKLLATKGSEDALIASTGDRIHPLCGIYRKTLLPLIEHRLATGQFSVKSMLREVHATYVELPSQEMENLNTPDEYRRVLGGKALKADTAGTHR